MRARHPLRVLSLPFLLAALPAQAPPCDPVPKDLLAGLDWRCIGPFRGGRCAAVAGVPGQRDTYWFGATGGGVWKSTDAGKTWKNVSDGFFGGSIGAIAVAPSDANTVFVGGGEKTLRGNVSSGDGVWKSTDGGATWTFAGLPDSRHISRLRVHPTDKNLVYAAVIGHAFGPNEERGVYRSKDGGQSWQRVLFANAQAGAVDLCLQPNDPNVLYATTWRVIRRPWTLESGGEGSSLWKSTDGGETWKELRQNPGLPKGTLGISCLTVSPARPERVWAMVEAEDGGLFRSDDAGASWTRINEDRSLRQRAWYFSRCYADPRDPETVYVLNVSFHKSTDGGKTFTTIGVPHGDNHDLWIDPADPARMIEGNDGGATVSHDGGQSWTGLDNQPTAQFYRVTTDTAVPYRIYGAQQDNSTVRIRSRSMGPGIGREDWESTAGGESGWLAPKPDDPEVVFGGNYSGYLQRYDHRLRLSRSVTVWPDNPMGDGPANWRYRFQWNFPILFSPHDRARLYTAGNVLFQSRDEGQSWEPISPDLTRNDKQKQQSSGGPITKDNTGVEYYDTIFAVAESPRVPGAIWCGSDDGLVHVTRDGGRTWNNVTPPQLPEWAQVNCIEASPHQDGGCYVAATCYKLDDHRPYLFATEDWGQTWREIVGGLDPHWFVRCVRADPVRPQLLYAGTERTVWMSCNGGRLWQKLALNLPLVPVTDLCVRDDALLAATQGRSFWVFDHLEQLRQVHPSQAELPVHLFAATTVSQYPGGEGEVAGLGRNPDRTPVVRFFVGGDADQPVTEAASLEVRDPDGKVVFTRSTTAKDEKEKLAVKRGINSVKVVFAEAKAPKILPGMILWSGGGGAPRPAPGVFAVKLVLGATTCESTLHVAKDPRTTASEAELQARWRLACDIRDLVTEAHEAIETIRALRTQMDAVVQRAEGEAKGKLEAKAKEVGDELAKVEEALYQTKSKSGQDPLNYPIKLTDKLLGVLGAVNGAEYGPTAGQVAVKTELEGAIRLQLAAFQKAKQDGVAAFNALALQLAVPYVK